MQNSASGYCAGVNWRIFKRGQKVLWIADRTSPRFLGRYHRAVVIRYTKYTRDITRSPVTIRVLETQEVREVRITELRLDYHSPECPDVPEDCGCVDDLNESE